MIDFEYDLKTDVARIKLISISGFSNKYKIYSNKKGELKGKIDLVFDKNIFLELRVHNAGRSLPKELLSASQSGNLIKLDYDRDSDSAFINLIDPKPGQAKSTYPFNPYEIGAEINLDLDHDDRILAIEILYASKHLPPEFKKKYGLSHENNT